MIRLKSKTKEWISRWLNNLSYRHSLLFDGWLSTFFSYTSTEEILKKAMVFAHFSKLDGDYLEFGCYQGHSFAAAFHFARKWHLNSMKFFAFDSFRGLPKMPSTEQQTSRLKAGDLVCGLDSFKRRLRRKKVDLSKVITISGFYENTLNKTTKHELNIKKAAVIYIDCDLYHSTVPVLNFVTDYIQDGTIIIFDDWFLFRGRPDQGEQKAFREWLQANPRFHATEYHKFGWCGNSFLIHCND